MTNRAPRRCYVGETIKGYQIVEEIPQEFPPTWSHQRKHNARRFKTIHLETGVEIERTLTQMRNSPLMMVWDRKNFQNLAGTTCGWYEVIGLSEECLKPQTKYRRAVTWKCRNLENGRIEILKQTDLIRAAKRDKRRAETTLKKLDYEIVDKKFKHGARVRCLNDELTQLYRCYHAMKQRCHLKSHRMYDQYGGKGMTVCQEWRDSFEVFRDDIIEDIGYNPDTKKLSLFIIRGTEFKKGNVQWVSVINKRTALTSEENYGDRILLDTNPATKKTGLDL